MIRRILMLAWLVGTPVLFPGCAGDEPKDPNRVSNIPWNRPEKWEGQGPMGGFSPQGGGPGGGSY